ncbi:MULTISPECIES: L-fucose:H+ symporter permease [unclassified Azospirillum]|uniref:L-fucose:H+ symporter permease n=1 Tax=unclassified Azospirillum TaxID=2630922 RepID=UPI000B6D87A6|nr:MULTISPECIES: L-fucose:H+ symporter permease [unclassified Azospirillum]SNS97406.1 MFS transporter, FHS family, L-fucose permease [Azospirillum sp. RU38E]SNT13862.1 MFS transporter, FHS family, L-fucose permease [Azospirillum sp. RU37A]
MTSVARGPKQWGPLILIVALFFLWGVANNLNDVLIPHLKKAFFLTDLQSGLVQSAFYLGYFFLALPAGLLMRRHGYKVGVVVGLVLFGTGALLFWPAAELRQYGLFLGALFVIASGLAFLETSANPLITVLGDPDKAERRLNLAQAFNPLGAVTAVLVGRQFILSGVEPTAAEFAAMSPDQLLAFQTAEASATQVPYLIIAAVVLVWALLVAVTRFPEEAGRPVVHDRPRDHVDRPIMGLLAHRRFLFGVVAQFFYVGAQVGVWSFMIRYAQHEVPGMGEKTAATYLTWSLVAFMAGRFAGTALMGRVDPTKLMALFAVANVGLMLFAVLVGGHDGLLALAATSFFMSIMFPTIFASSLKGLGPLTKTGSSFLVMSIIGGAVLTALMGGISDASTIRWAFLVPCFCFVIVGLFGLSAPRNVAGHSMLPVGGH